MCVPASPKAVSEAQLYAVKNRFLSIVQTDTYRCETEARTKAGVRAGVLPASMRGGILLKLTTLSGSGNDKSSPHFPRFFALDVRSGFGRGGNAGFSSES